MHLSDDVAGRQLRPMLIRPTQGNIRILPLLDVLLADVAAEPFERALRGLLRGVFVAGARDGPPAFPHPPTPPPNHCR